MQERQLLKLLKTFQGIEDIQHGQYVVNYKDGHPVSISVVKTIAKPITVVIS